VKNRMTIFNLLEEVQMNLIKAITSRDWEYVKTANFQISKVLDLIRDGRSLYDDVKD